MRFFIQKLHKKRMNKFYERATDGAVPYVKFEFLSYRKIKTYTDETKIYINNCFHVNHSISIRTGNSYAGKQF